jgi:threonine dehydratase
MPSPHLATSLDSLPVTFSDIRTAAQRLGRVCHRTPVLESTTLNDRVGARVYLKCENYQRAGAFKFRGAYNAMSRLDAEQRARGVLAYSSGNHAQAVALAGTRNSPHDHHAE